ncbi:MAG TPA: histidine phosphatase family protein [Victivallales bacterium]|nr:histidine phosphatase family protein [Victivallales bacterium]
MRKLILRAIILLFLFQFTLTASEKLMFAAVLFRHGDRTPTKALKNNTYNWKIGLGELTPIGMLQEFNLGKYFHNRYIKKFKLIPEEYNSSEVYVRATDSNRTLMSAESLLYGFYPSGTGPLLADKKPALPYRFQPVPVHSAMELNDKLLSAQSIYKCKLHKLQKELVYDTEKWQKTQKLYEHYFKSWSIISGFKIQNLEDVKSFAANVFIRNIHGIKQPNGITENDKKILFKLYPWIHAEQYLPQVIGMQISKDLIHEIINNSEKSIEGKTVNKLFLYSAHDTNILGLMSALGAPLKENPPYASFVGIELYEIKNEYFVKILYNKKYVKLALKSDNDYYPFKAFVNYCNKLM